MKKIKYISLACMLFAIIYGCGKNETDFKDFFNGHEVVYTGAVGEVISQPGNLRVALKWRSSTDPTITKYVVYWNNKADSQVVNITAKTDSVNTVIEGLDEYVYSFSIFSFDAKGNKSVAKEVNNVKVYGPIYQSTLLNRAYDAVEPSVINSNGNITLNFITPDTTSNALNVNTEVKYTNDLGLPVSILVPSTQNNVVITDYKSGTAITYRSAYEPQRGAYELFYVSEFSAYPVFCDKSFFRTTNSPNDIRAEYGTTIDKLWDGTTKPESYPNIFHSNEYTFPHQLTIDLGIVYNGLSQIEETGRDCCHNPDQFEV
ncbi:MAG: hypothetical protein EOO92_27560, partial [Pedobacter sp.]